MKLFLVHEAVSIVAVVLAVVLLLLLLHQRHEQHDQQIPVFGSGTAIPSFESARNESMM